MCRKSAEVRQAFLLRLSDLLRGLREPEELLSVAANELGKHLRASRVGFGQIQPDDNACAFRGGYADAVEPLFGTFS